MGILHSLWAAISPLLTPLAMILAAVLHGKISKTPGASEKAAHLARLAQDAAATVMMLFPTLKGAELIAKIVAILSTVAGVPTTDPTVLERAAAGAVAAAGKTTGP
jgi:hypothetical protein